MFDDSDDSDELTPRWWLDRGDPTRAASALKPADAVETTEAEHRALAAELRARNLACVYEDGQTWVWTPEVAAELEQPDDRAATRSPGVVPVSGGLDADRRPPRRGPRPGEPSRRSRSGS